MLRGLIYDLPPPFDAAAKSDNHFTALYQASLQINNQGTVEKI
jgi:hypothetical protein